MDLLQWFIIFLIKNTSGSGIKNETISRKNYTNQLLENLIKEKYTHLLLTIFGVQIEWICN